MGLETLIWVISYEAKCYVATPIDFDDIPTNGGRGGVDRCSSVVSCAGRRALYYLEVVAMYMKRMAAAVIVVDHYLNCVVIV